MVNVRVIDYTKLKGESHIFWFFAVQEEITGKLNI